jgi:hypothetical protein
MRGLNDLVLRDRGFEAIALPVTVLVAYGTVTLVAGLGLFRLRHGAR